MLTTTITYGLSLGVILIVISLFLFSHYDVLPILFLVIGCCICFVFVFVSFAATTKEIKIPITNANILSGKNAIYVETSKGDFKLINLADKSILTSKEIYVVIPCNYWNIEKISEKTIIWNN